jgi:hypothetical protein
MLSRLITACVFISCVESLWAANFDNAYAELLKKYVTTDGVRYGAWKNNPEDVRALNEVVGKIAEPGAVPDSKKDQLAFYVNAYNAWILHEALQKYPTKSVKDPLFTFFLGKRIKVGGELMSFNHLEKDLIRAKFGEPRVHFALNCASRSCPPLLPEPFRGSTLDAQLDRIARGFINGRGVQVKGRQIALSKIFDWYKEDFAAAGGVLPFINRYRQPPIPADSQITIMDYDWSLNKS